MNIGKNCEVCNEPLIQRGRHLDTAQVRSIQGVYKGYCCRQCGDLDEYSWGKYGCGARAAMTHGLSLEFNELEVSP